MTLFGSFNLSHGTDACPHHQLMQCCEQMTQSVQFYNSNSVEAISPLKVLFSHVYWVFIERWNVLRDSWALKVKCAKLLQPFRLTSSWSMLYLQSPVRPCDSIYNHIPINDSVQGIINIINMCSYDRTVDSEVFLTNKLKKCILRKVALKTVCTKIPKNS